MSDTIKLKSGKKHARLQKYDIYDKGQKKIYKDFISRMGKEYKPPAEYGQYMDALRQPFQPGSAQNQGMDYLKSLISQDPQAMQQFEAPIKREFSEQIMPQISERFAGLGALNSSAFQQSIAQAGAGLSERLAALRGGLGMQATSMLPGMSQMNQQNAQGMMQGAMFPYNMQNQQSQMALGTPGFGYANIPAQQQSPNAWQSAMPGIGQGAGAAATYWAIQALSAASSEKVKENIRPYDKGLEVIKGLEVKQYDYIEAVGGEKGRVGVIAEMVPEELTKNILYNGRPEGVLSVDLYGLIGLLINSVKSLDARLQKMEAA